MTVAARIGPNSVLDLVPQLERALGPDERDRLLAGAGLSQLPPGEGLMDETPAANLHQILRAEHPQLAPDLVRKAGRATAQHIIAKRMPPAALTVLRHLPMWLASPLLASVIEKHAWTFAGSGQFRLHRGSPIRFELIDNPVVRGERASTPICHWHAAVFESLFQEIVSTDLHCRETQCCATGAPSCLFELT